MKRRKLITICLTLAVLCAGCASASAQENTAQQSTVLEEGQTEIYGKVRSANGNEITLVIGTLENQRGNRPGEQDGSDEGAAPPGGGEIPDGDVIPQEDDATGERGNGRPSGEGMPERSAGKSGDEDTAASPVSMEGPFGDMPAGGPPGMEGGSGNSGGSGFGQGGMGGGSGITGLSLNYTGEEETFLIPVTASITTGQGDNARTVRFTQIGEKNILRLVLNEDGTIVAVQILG